MIAIKRIHMHPAPGAKKWFLPLLLLMALPQLSFHDFLDYWTVKLNGVVVYDSSKDEKKGLFVYKVDAGKLSAKDTLEVEYFTDSPCHNCIHYYFMGEYKASNGEPYEVMPTYLNEQKSLGLAPYKKALTDLVNAGEEGQFKVIYHYTSQHPNAHPLFAIRAK